MLICQQNVAVFFPHLFQQTVIFSSYFRFGASNILVSSHGVQEERKITCILDDQIYTEAKLLEDPTIAPDVFIST